MSAEERNAQVGDRHERINRILDWVQQLRANGKDVSDTAVTDKYPDLMPELGQALSDLNKIRPLAPLFKDQVPAVERRFPASSPRNGVLADLSEDYEVLEEIASGGQGFVHRALDRKTGREVAIKFMNKTTANSPEMERFRREIDFLRTIAHPNVVKIHADGVAGKHHYFVMDYIRGKPLDKYLKEAGRSSRDLIALCAQICEAVNAAHVMGVIHRDLKPSNILIDAQHVPHILDFGLAKAANRGMEPQMTRTGQFVGSLPWAAPEQAEGAPTKIDMRTDVYSLSVIFYQALTGKFPYEVYGNPRDVINHILQTEPLRPRKIRREINGDMEAILLKGLSKKRDDRYLSAGDLERDLRCYLRNEPVQAKKVSVRYVARKWLMRYRQWFAAAAVILLALGCVGGLIRWHWKQKMQAEQAAAQERAERLALEQREQVTALLARLTADWENPWEPREDGRWQAVIRDIWTRVRDGQATELDRRALATALLRGTIVGRSLIQKDQQQIGFADGSFALSYALEVNSRCPLDAFVGLGVKPQILINGQSVPLNYAENIVFKYSNDDDLRVRTNSVAGNTSRSSARTYKGKPLVMANKLIPVPSEVGSYRIGGVLNVSLLKSEGQGRHQEIPGTTVTLTLPEISVSVVEEYPAEYPPRIPFSASDEWAKRVVIYNPIVVPTDRTNSYLRLPICIPPPKFPVAMRISLLDQEGNEHYMGGVIVLNVSGRSSQNRRALQKYTFVETEIKPTNNMKLDYLRYQDKDIFVLTAGSPTSSIHWGDVVRVKLTASRTLALGHPAVDQYLDVHLLKSRIVLPGFLWRERVLPVPLPGRLRELKTWFWAYLIVKYDLMPLLPLRL